VRDRTGEGSRRRLAVSVLALAGFLFGIVLLVTPAATALMGSTASAAGPASNAPELVVIEQGHDLLRRAGHLARSPGLRALLVTLAACAATAAVVARRWWEPARAGDAWSPSCVPHHRRGPPHAAIL
jgi:hypothetical protein